MSVLFVHDHRFKKYNNKIFSNGCFSDSVIERYTSVFGKIRFVSRIEEAENGDKLSEITIPEFDVIDAYNNNALLEKEIMVAEYVVIRIPSLLGMKALKYIKKYNKPYLVELVGCPWDAYWHHSLIGKLAAPFMWYLIKKVTKSASYVLYVSENFLQRRYPTKGKSVACSNALLTGYDKNSLKNRLEKIDNLGKEITIGTVGAVNVRYKGQQYVIKAISKLVKEGYNIKYRLAGGGDNSYLKSIAEKYGVEENVEFCGSVPHDKIFDFMSCLDVYIQPSLAESHGRVLVEAMSVACPVIGAATGGIPELVNKKYVFKRGNVNDICAKIKLMTNSKEMISEAKRSFERAKDFVPEKLERRRKDFFELFKKESVKEND